MWPGAPSHLKTALQLVATAQAVIKAGPEKLQ